jgi:hypothetical protein
VDERALNRIKQMDREAQLQMCLSLFWLRVFENLSRDEATLHTDISLNPQNPLFSSRISPLFESYSKGDPKSCSTYGAAILFHLPTGWVVFFDTPHG